MLTEKRTPGAGTEAAIDLAKKNAAVAAVDEVASGMQLGLGTGSTVRFFLEALAQELRAGRLEDIRGVPTSIDTENRCRDLGIPAVELHEAGSLDLAIDGADEVSPTLDLVKGLGGALLREKIVVQAASRFVVIADESKEVSRLGQRSPIPVEVVPFAWQAHLPFFRSLGAEPVPRRDPGGELVVTDNGNYLVDLGFASGLDSPAELRNRLERRAGIVEHGLFLGTADLAFIGSADEVSTRRASRAVSESRTT